MRGTVLSTLAVACAVGLAACKGGEKPAPAMMNQPMPMMGAQTPPGVTSSDPRAALFLEKGCPQCHTISALGIKSPAEVGPDLTFAYQDVKNRFSVPLETFLHNPTGTMQVVLSSMIQLSPEERDSVIHILKALDRERKEKTEKDGK